MPLLNELEHAKSILADALAALAKRNAGRITGVHVMVGEIAEISKEKIEAHWLELSQNTPAEGAPIHFHIIEAEVQCMACFEKYHPEGGKIHCPHCGSFGAKILKGEEFYLESIE